MRRNVNSGASFFYQEIVEVLVSDSLSFYFCLDPIIIIALFGLFSGIFVKMENYN